MTGQSSGLGSFLGTIINRLRGPQAPHPTPTPGGNRPLSHEEAMNRLMDVEPWCIDYIDIRQEGETSTVEIRGWAILVPAGKGAVTFTLNGRAFDQVTYPTPRPDIERLFWYRPNALQSGFTCTAQVQTADLFPDGRVTFAYVDKATRQPLNPRHAYYFYDVTTDSQPLADPARRKRVHGSEDESAYRLVGFDTYVKLGLVLNQVAGRTFGDFHTILDWGCGSGRLTRHFADLPVGTVHGVDIDVDNAQWCADNLTFGKFQAVPLHPPTPLAAGSFDLAIGISVFTHLDEPDQLAWLAELQRIAAPGAILLMTVHGNTAIGRSGMNAERLARLQSHGFLDLGRNLDLVGAIPDEEYYRNVFHTQDYLHRVWTDYFEILEIVPGYIGNFHDLVIMRKRS